MEYKSVSNMDVGEGKDPIRNPSFFRSVGWREICKIAGRASAKIPCRHARYIQDSEFATYVSKFPVNRMFWDKGRPAATQSLGSAVTK